MTEHLLTGDRLPRPDDLYDLLVQAHRDLDREQSRLLNARLILLLANHLGDLEVVREAVAIARQGLQAGKDPESGDRCGSTGPGTTRSSSKGRSV